MTEQEKKMWEDDIKFIEKLNKENKELRERINKALEYIRDEISLREFCDTEHYTEIMEILKGEKNEENN